MAKNKILIVDDEYFLTEMLKSRLEFLGFDCDVAENGKECLAQLEKHKFDLVVMDIMMPEMDGLETTKKIRQNPKFKNLPVIFLTARARAEDRKLAMEAGGTDYLPKPFEHEDLQKIVDKYLS